MLPGFRTLFAIVLLSVSVLVFGLGAAAFLRAAHDNLASTPAYRPIELAYAPRIEMPAETLSMMRVHTQADVGAPALRSDQPVALSVLPREEPATAAVAAPVPIEVTAPIISLPAVPAPSVSVEPQKTDDLTTVVAPTPQPAEIVKPAPVVESPPAPVASAPTTSAPDTVATSAAPDTKPATTVEAAGQDSLTAADKADVHTTGALAALQSPTPIANETPDVVANPAQAAAPQPVATAAPATPSVAPAESSPKPNQVAALAEPEIPAQPPLPINSVRIPKPRIDPKIFETQRKEERARQQRAARAQAEARARARRVATIRARAAAQTRTADPFAASPFQQPAAPTTR